MATHRQRRWVRQVIYSGFETPEEVRPWSSEDTSGQYPHSDHHNTQECEESRTLGNNQVVQEAPKPEAPRRYRVRAGGQQNPELLGSSGPEASVMHDEFKMQKGPYPTNLRFCNLELSMALEGDGTVATHRQRRWIRQVIYSGCETPEEVRPWSSKDTSGQYPKVPPTVSSHTQQVGSDL